MEEIGRPEMEVTSQPRPTEAGDPDFRVWDRKGPIIGYIEAKPLREDLERAEKSDQLTRYLETFPNLILTNFLEFRLYRDGQPIASAQLGRPYVLTVLQEMPPLEHAGEARSRLDLFFGYSLRGAHRHCPCRTIESGGRD